MKEHGRQEEASETQSFGRMSSQASLRPKFTRDIISKLNKKKAGGAKKPRF